DSILEEVKTDLEGICINLNLALEFNEKIGEGGLGEVYRGHIVGGSYNNEVAIKVSKRDKKSLENLRREAYISGQLKHDDLVKILHYEENEKGGMIIMDYINGNDLSKIVDRHKKLGLRLPQRFSAFITWVCCEALKYAHTARVHDEDGKEVIGLVHRDISPGNIIVNNVGYPKIVDFGIGLLSSDLNNPNTSRQIAGKLGFMAPEILNPEIIKGKAIDQRIDIYSLGMVMDYLVRGKNPLLETVKQSSGKVEALAEVKESLKRGIKPLEEDVDGLDEDFVEIIKKATSIYRKERYQSAFHMKEDLRAYLFDKGYGPDRDRLKLYLELIYTTGMLRYLTALKNKENDIKIPTDFENKLKKAKELAGYMVRDGKFCLETLKNAGYNT
ncbi:MAG: serine/threonine-protein kinase, partial [Nanoarchaeota archaeon]